MTPPATPSARSYVPTSSIDDIGLLPVSAETAETLYRVVDAAYERTRPLVESAPRRLDELMPKTIANATVDRLLHHAHIVMTTGDSIRLTQATTGKGVSPSTDDPRQALPATTGQFDGHHRAEPLTAPGQIPLAIAPPHRNPQVRGISGGLEPAGFVISGPVCHIRATPDRACHSGVKHRSELARRRRFGIRSGDEHGG